MIKSFKCRETEKIWRGIKTRKVSIVVQERALRKLRQLNASISLQDLKIPPSNYLERLSGDRKEQYSIRINNQWRLCFEWDHGNSHEVEVVDYH